MESQNIMNIIASGREAINIGRALACQLQAQTKATDLMLQAIEASVATGDIERIRDTVAAVRIEHDKTRRREVVKSLLADVGWEE